jgi:transcriptional regulator with XRE-family HTH domain
MRSRHTPQEIEKILSRRERRGLTWAALAEEAGVSTSTLQNWARKRRARVGPAFVEVAVAPDEASGDLALEIVLRSGHQVRVPRAFDPEHLRRVVRALASC